jgi:hypothetical protein
VNAIIHIHRKVDYFVLETKRVIISHVVLGECNYSHSPKGELFCVRDKVCSPFNECMNLSHSTNSQTASLLSKR